MQSVPSTLSLTMLCSPSSSPMAVSISGTGTSRSFPASAWSSFDRQPAMAVVQRLGERVRNTGPDPDHGGFLDAKPLGDRVGGLEADAADVLRQTVGIFRHDLHGIVAVGLVDAHRPRRADAVGMQERP